MNCIYIAHTPYHTLISCGLASLYENSKQKYLIIISDFEYADIFYKIICDWKANPFTEVKLLPGLYKVKREDRIKSITILRKNIKILKEFIHSKSIERCKTFVFNDSRPEGQNVAYLNSKRNGVNTYVEDGFAAYNHGPIPNISSYKRYLPKIFYGPSYEYTPIMGTYKSITQAMVFNPEIVIPELKSKEILKIPRDIFHKLDPDLVIALLKNHNIDTRELKLDCIIILPHSEIMEKFETNNLIAVYKDLIDLLENSFDSIGVKYHPREDRGDFLELLKNKKIKIIPKSLPLEAFVLFLINQPPKVIVGDMSTALLTCNMILKNRSCIISTIKMISLQEEQAVSNVFNIVGIKMPSSVQELRNILFI